jgi:hypothetical protein
MEDVRRKLMQHPLWLKAEFQDCATHQQVKTQEVEPSMWNTKALALKQRLSVAFIEA